MLPLACSHPQSSFGEVGFYILASCLLRLFPDCVFPPGSTSPLSVSDFRTFVLLPEVAVKLMMDDLTQDRAATIDTLQHSVKYGDTRFVLDPDDEVEYDLSIREACRHMRDAAPGDSYRDGDCSTTGRTKRRVRRKRTTLKEVSAASDTGGESIAEDVDDGPERKRQRMSLHGDN